MDRSREHLLLERHPGVRASVLASTDFQQWRDSLRTVLVDGELFTVFGGDRLLDSDQLIVEWVRQHSPSLLREECDP